MAFISNFCVFFETSPRVMDVIIFTLPRSIEGLWDLILKLGWVKPIPFGLNTVFALSLAMAMALYKSDKDNIHSSYSRIIDFVFNCKDDI
jgi:hypothetical protein